MNLRRLAAVFAALLICCLHASAQWDKDVLEFRGRLALQDGKYAQAIEQFNILAKLDTTDCWTFFYRGIAKYNLGDVRGARTDFDRSLRLNPVFTNGYHYRAITKSRMGQYDDALADFETAISLRPGFNGLYFSRGVTYFLAQKFEDAVADFDKFIRHSPKEPSAYLNRGASYLFLGDTLKALSDYNQAIRLDRFEAEGYVRRARLYAAQQNYDDAIRDMNYALELDSTNTFAYFNRALMLFEIKDFRAAMDDLNTVLVYEPGNALTLYNRSLVRAQLGDYEGALDDMDRVININPQNVLAYFNRAWIFAEMGRYRNALHDYDRAIELYPDFAKAYQNRSWVEHMLGMNKESKRDYQTAQRKIEDYRRSGSDFADTTRKYSSLIALDADFARQGFDDELLQHRDIDVRLSPLHRVRAIENGGSQSSLAFANRYENGSVMTFIASLDVPAEVAQSDILPDGRVPAEMPPGSDGFAAEFEKAMRAVQAKQYASALSHYNAAALVAGDDALQRAFCLMNRAVLKAEMVDFIASIENNVQTLSMDDQGSAKTRVADCVLRSYDYSEALADMQEAVALAPDVAYLHYDLGGLLVLSGEAVGAIGEYNRALELYPTMGEGYYNRGLVLIFLKDREKGCIDLSRAGELGIKDSYSVINKYCEQDD